MTVPDNTRAAGARVEQLLAQLRSGPDPRAAAVAEDLVRCLVRLYGAGLERIVQIVGAERAADLCADPLVESLLLVHDLHPLDTVTRVRRALDSARSALGSSARDVAYRGIADDGVVRVLLIRTGCGCGSSLAAVRETIGSAIRQAAPEVPGVEVEVAAEPPPAPLLRIARRPGMAA